MLSVLLCCAAIVAVASSLPSGAPSQACGPVMPGGPHTNGGAIAAQAPPVPWVVDLSGFDLVNGTLQYTPGTSYTITLMQAPNVATPLRGFLIVGRMLADTTTMTGSFAIPNDGFTQRSLCTVSEAGVTHNNPGRTDRNGTYTFTWTAPMAGTGPVEFRYAIVRNVNTWWANALAGVVQEAGNINGASSVQGIGFWTLLTAAVALALKTVL